MHANPSKVESMIKWPKPNTLKSLRGFFKVNRLLPQVHQGLQGDCRPLDQTTEKGGF